MRSDVLDIEAPGAIERAVARLRQGHLVAFPTDTLYGIGAAYDDSRAIARLFQVKGRPAAKGIPILISDVAHLERVVAQVPEPVWSIIDGFWPGPLTLILPRRVDLPLGLSPNDGIAVRIPDHPGALRFIEAAGGAVAATSANKAGQRPASSAPDVLASLEGQVAIILDGGSVDLGRASTILDCRAGHFEVVRQGPVTLEQLELVSR